jgi:hypothetical protein
LQRVIRVGLLLSVVLAAVACQAEQRPGTVQRIGPGGSPQTSGSPQPSGSPQAGGPQSGTVYGPGGLPAPGAPQSGTVYGPGGLPAPAASSSGPTPGETYYTPLNNVALYQLIALDFQEISQLTNEVTQGRPLPSAEILNVYENGKHARVGTTFRMLRTFARADARQREFPEAARFFNSPSFIDDPVYDAIQGTGSAANYTPAQRRQAIQKGVQRVMAYWFLQELITAEMRVRDGNTNPATGGPRNIDEAWAIYMGPPQATGFPLSLSATATSRETNFRRQGQIDRPLREGLQRAQRAAADGNLSDFQSARRDVESRLNAMFYLASARYLNEAFRAAQGGNAANATGSQMEGLAFYMAIQPKVAAADPAADQAVAAYYRADPTTLSQSRRDEALAALNRTIEALGLRPEDRVTPADFSS